MNNHEVTIEIISDGLKFRRIVCGPNYNFYYDNEIRNYRGRNWKFRTTGGSLQRVCRALDFELTLPVMIAIVNYFYGRINFSVNFQEIDSTPIITYGNNMYVYISRPTIKAILREHGLDADKLPIANKATEVILAARVTRNWNTQSTPDHRFSSSPISQAFNAIYYSGADSYRLVALNTVNSDEEALLFDDEEDYIMEAMEALSKLTN